MKSAASKSDLNKLHRNYEICSKQKITSINCIGTMKSAAPFPLVHSLHTVHTVNIFAEFMTDWEIGNFAASGLDETSTYQMKEHCDHCAPFSMNKKIRPDRGMTPTNTASIQTLRAWVVTQDCSRR